MDGQPAIFLSYRRVDSPGWTHHFYERLADEFGSANVFQDLRSIPQGADFKEEIARALAPVKVMLCVIGRTWLTLPAREDWEREAGLRQIDSAADFVRWEIAIALQSDIRVIPVLVDDATMPSESDLPAEIRALAARNALRIPPDYVEEGLDRVVASIRGDMEHAIREPVRAFLGPDEAVLGESWEMFLPTVPGPIELPDSVRPLHAARGWIQEHDGCDYRTTHLRLDLIGVRERPVHLRAMRAKILETAAREPGTRVVSPSAGDSEPAPVLIDLDAASPIARRLPPAFDPYGEDPYGIDPTHLPPITATIARDEYVSFQITAHAHNATYRWRLELELLVGDATVTLELPDDDGVFSTTCASESDADYEWAWHMKPLVLAPRRDIERSIEAKAYPALRLTFKKRLQRLLRIGN